MQNTGKLNELQVNIERGLSLKICTMTCQELHWTCYDKVCQWIYEWSFSKSLIELFLQLLKR